MKLFVCLAVLVAVAAASPKKSPYPYGHHVDTDGDGIPDHRDPDDDGDGVADRDAKDGTYGHGYYQQGYGRGYGYGNYGAYYNQGRDYNHGYRRTLAPAQSDDKTWVFAYDVPWEERNKIDENGALGGASIEINQAICAQAGKTCSHVVTPIEKCWDSETGLGEGLLNGWFDACGMYIPTPERANIFAFTGEIFTANPGQLYQLSTSSHQLSDISGLKVGVPSGWYTDEGCLTRSGLNAGEVQEAPIDQLSSLLQAGTIDLAFAPEGFLDGEASGLADTQQCSLNGAGHGAMHTRQSKLPEWYGAAVMAVRRSGQLRAICARYPSVDNCILH